VLDQKTDGVARDDLLAAQREVTVLQDRLGVHAHSCTIGELPGYRPA
jgi:hypothetical protein